MAATDVALASLRTKPGADAAARATRSSTADERWMSTALIAAGSGNVSGASTRTYSPARPKGSRLVARMRMRGQVDRSWSTKGATASIRCSQLSSTSTQSLAARWSAMVDSSVR